MLIPAHLQGLTDISIKPLAVGWRLHTEINGISFDGDFYELPGFMLALDEMVKFYSVRAGKLRVKDAGFTREVVPGDGRMVLPGDRSK